MAEVSGKFRFQTTILSDYPAVGDFVLVNYWNESGNSAIIESLLPRKSAFVRKAAGEPQQKRSRSVATNMDIVFLCMALNNDFNLRRLERYISIGWDSGAMPVIVLTKSDLCDDLEPETFRSTFSCFWCGYSGYDFNRRKWIQGTCVFISKEETIAFIGFSDVGKSTLSPVMTISEEEVERYDNTLEPIKKLPSKPRRILYYESNFLS